MSGWENEKKRFLSMSVDDKRKGYRSSEYFQVDQIPTWPQYAQKIGNLPEKIPMLVNNQINTSQNEELAKKISVFRGDITTLEVSYLKILSVIISMYDEELCRLMPLLMQPTNLFWEEVE